MSTPILALGRRMSPRHRRWQKLLASCSLDPDLLLAPVDAPGVNDVLICGHSRSGTALVSAALWQPPEVLTVMEPWDAFRLPPAELFRSLRVEMAKTGRISRGRLDVGALQHERVVRWQRDGERTFDVEYRDDTIVAVKMPVFWRYLDVLPDVRFIVCVRDPVEVISSYARVGGRLAEGLDYDIPFNREMNDALRESTDDLLRRRIAMFDYVSERIIPHLGRPNVHVVRYEDWTTDPEGQLAALSDFLGVALGPPSMTIRPAETPTPVDDVVSVIASECRTAEMLGYSRGRSVSDVQPHVTPTDENGRG